MKYLIHYNKPLCERGFFFFYSFMFSDTIWILHLPSTPPILVEYVCVYFELFLME